ncbi:zinc ribbon domain-containing protein [uncultured Brachyspira sp.]|uniref:zinc ribbon domain-containing protein n=1 Tax=uncultured Brachyspira sp. TaxID=221953 RepID=UPI00259B40E4|nr:zinc ribbon domain-containing protein [uncultured Brachyspira sp.]
MLPNKPPYFYKCNSCVKIFNSKIKVNPILEIFNIRKIINPFLKCPNCGSKDIKIALINNLINKNEVE